jgi:hypothetical protein
LTVRSAESLTWIEPAVVIEIPVAGMLAPVLSFGVVTRVVSQWPKSPRTKSLRVAVVDVDERVSEATEAKHSPPRLSRLRVRPPSQY